MAAEDRKAPFMHIPWAASLLNRPDVVLRVPGSREFKASTEDSLFAEILKTPRTIRSCISFYQRPAESDTSISEVSTLVTTGDGMNGHPGIMHGGVVASIIDESMGILQVVDHERIRSRALDKGLAKEELPPFWAGSLTAELKINYLKPVQSPGTLVCTAKYIKRDGRKEWIYAEIRQTDDMSKDCSGEAIVCATGEGLFIGPKLKKSKL